VELASSEVRPVGGKKWYRNPWILAGGGGGVLALGALAMRKRGGTPDAAVGSSTGQYLQPANFDDGGAGAYNNIQNEFEALQAQLSGFGTTADIEALRQQINGLGKPMAPKPLPKTSPKVEVIPGKAGLHWRVWDLARYLVPSAKKNDPTAVNQEVALLEKYNPAWKGHDIIIGGRRYTNPRSTWP